MVKSRYIGDGHPTFNRNPYNGYINPYYWVDGHPLLYGNNGSLVAHIDLFDPHQVLSSSIRRSKGPKVLRDPFWHDIGAEESLTEAGGHRSP